MKKINYFKRTKTVATTFFFKYHVANFGTRSERVVDFLGTCTVNGYSFAVGQTVQFEDGQCATYTCQASTVQNQPPQPRFNS